VRAGAAVCAGSECQAAYCAGGQPRMDAFVSVGGVFVGVVKCMLCFQDAPCCCRSLSSARQPKDGRRCGYTTLSYCSVVLLQVSSHGMMSRHPVALVV
jgi:hypothetical protein